MGRLHNDSIINKVHQSINIDYIKIDNYNSFSHNKLYIFIKMNKCIFIICNEYRIEYKGHYVYISIVDYFVNYFYKTSRIFM